MAFTYPNAAGALASGNNATSLAPALPTHQAGDLLIVQFQNFGGTDSRTPSVPADWTGYTWQNGTSSHGVWYKVALSDAESAPTITLSGTGVANDTQLARCFMYRPAAGKVARLRVVGANSTNASADNVGPITGIDDESGDLRLLSCGKSNDWNGTPTLSGWTLATALSESTTGSDAGMALLHILSSDGAATGDLTVTDNGGTASNGVGLGKMLAFYEADPPFEDEGAPNLFDRTTSVARGLAAAALFTAVLAAQVAVPVEAELVPAVVSVPAAPASVIASPVAPWRLAIPAPWRWGDDTVPQQPPSALEDSEVWLPGAARAPAVPLAVVTSEALPVPPVASSGGGPALVVSPVVPWSVALPAPWRDGLEEYVPPTALEDEGQAPVLVTRQAPVWPAWAGEELAALAVEDGEPWQPQAPRAGPVPRALASADELPALGVDDLGQVPVVVVRPAPVRPAWGGDETAPAFALEDEGQVEAPAFTWAAWAYVGGGEDWIAPAALEDEGAAWTVVTPPVVAFPTWATQEQPGQVPDVLSGGGHAVRMSPVVPWRIVLPQPWRQQLEEYVPPAPGGLEDEGRPVRPPILVPRAVGIVASADDRPPAGFAALEDESRMPSLRTARWTAAALPTAPARGGTVAPVPPPPLDEPGYDAALAAAPALGDYDARWAPIWFIDVSEQRTETPVPALVDEGVMPPAARAMAPRAALTTADEWVPVQPGLSDDQAPPVVPPVAVVPVAPAITSDDDLPIVPSIVLEDESRPWAFRTARWTAAALPVPPARGGALAPLVGPPEEQGYDAAEAAAPALADYDARWAPIWFIDVEQPLPFVPAAPLEDEGTLAPPATPVAVQIPAYAPEEWVPPPVPALRDDDYTPVAAPPARAHVLQVADEEWVPLPPLFADDPQQVGAQAGPIVPGPHFPVWSGDELVPYAALYADDPQQVGAWAGPVALAPRFPVWIGDERVDYVEPPPAVTEPFPGRDRIRGASNKNRLRHW
jgi:hypothetical protein